MEDRYVANKLGLVNFWYYDVEEFELSDGKLLLRGSNGSGKSVTMQSFIPLLLDGNKAPERLDPFGTKSRTIVNYLLDEDTNERTAYLYIEFKKADSYITIGMGLKAVKNKKTDSWYFILKDGRRINKDLYLYREAGEMIPLTKKQLENELGDVNFFTDSQKKYMDMVNKTLFGFDNIEEYEELLNLLISIRSPKLSKDFKPTEIYKILTDSLKVLSDEDLRPMSESMEHMDNLKNSLDDSRRSQKSANNIKFHYDKYNTFVLYEKAKGVVEGNKSLVSSEKKLKDGNGKLKVLDNRMKELKKLEEEKDSQLTKATDKYESLIKKEGYKSKKELIELEERISEANKNLEGKNGTLLSKQNKEKEVAYNLKDEKDKKDISEGKVQKALDGMVEIAEKILFEDGKGIKDRMKEHENNMEIDFLTSSIKKYEGRIKEGVGLLKEYEEQRDKYKEVEIQRDGLKKDFEEEKNKLNISEELFLTSKEDFKVDLINITKNNKYFNLYEEEKLHVFEAVEKINDYSNIQEIHNRLQNIYNQKENDYKGYIQVEKKLIAELNREIKDIEDEVSELKNKKEVEPERTDGVKRNRKRLEDRNIPFIPLYKALDFKNSTEEKIMGKVESSLLEMGLIDALIIEEVYREEALKFDEGMEDKYIFSEPNLLSFNLSSLLTVDKTLKGDNLYMAVDEVLQSIFLENDGGTYLDEKGNFKIGILRGKSTDNYVQRFIGEASRKRHRERIIIEKQNCIEDVRKRILKHEECIEYQKNNLILIAAEFSKLPNTNGIKEGLKLLKEGEEKLKQLDEKLLVIDKKAFDLGQVLKTINERVIEKTSILMIPKNIKDYEDALDGISEYKDLLRELQVGLNNLETALKIIDKSLENLDSIRMDIDNILYELTYLNNKLKDDNLKRETLLELIKTIDIDEIEKEIEECLNIRKNNPEDIKNYRSEYGKLESDEGKLLDVIQELEKIIVEEREKFINVKKVFKEEYELGYVEETSDIDVLKYSSKVVKEFGIDENRKREYFSNNLIESINKNSGELREYGLKRVTLFESEETNSGIRERMDLKCKVQGKDVYFLVLIEQIKKDIDELDLLISEEERKIFEEVLMNTISEKVRAKIHQSTAWVKTINSLMETMDTSSSLKLSISWVPKKAEGEGELDVSKIIDIMHRGDRSTDEDIKNLAKHFSSKVKDELRKYEGTGEVRNYHSIIKDVLDYRQWYEFKLFFTKNNERKQELTNNKFFQFSGGEKAMAMYIPLFSAIYARYKKARIDCPRMLSMDEAFAGVDENNIRDMFRLLKKLELDYILNSQILWGDYDTVDNLSICELIREENDDVVTVLRYHWNGKEKTLLS